MIITKILNYFKALSKRLLVGWPINVGIISLMATAFYELVARNDTMFPIKGVPVSLIYLSLLITLLILPFHALMAFTFCGNEIRGDRNFRQMTIMFCVCIPFAVCTTILALNGALDDTLPQKHRVKVLGLHELRKTSYVKVQDWRDLKGFVLFSEPQAFLKVYPVGSTVTVMTKPGKFGYELLIGIPNLGLQPTSSIL